MRYGIFLLLAGIIAFNWESIKRELAPMPAVADQQAQGVILYATSWCGYCQKTREFFRQHNIAYTEHDVEKSSQGRTEYEQLRGKGVPLVLIDGEVLRGYNPKKMKQLLDIQ